MVQIHPSSVIERGASLGEGVRVGPFCIVGPDVVLGDGCELVSHAVIAGSGSSPGETELCLLIVNHPWVGRRRVQFPAA